MKKTALLMALGVLALGAITSTVLGEDRVSVKPVVPDKLERVVLNQQELGGEINRRINDMIYKNYMVLNLDGDWLDKFKNRTDRNGKGYVYYGVGKVIDAGGLFSRYTGDPKVIERTHYLIDQLRSSRDPDGYLGFWNVEPNNLQDYINWILHEQEYINLSLAHNYQWFGDPKVLEDARIMGDYIIKTFPTKENGFYNPGAICTAGLPEGFLALYKVTGEKKYLDFAANVEHGNNSGEIQLGSLKTWKQSFNTRPAHVYVMLARIYAQTELYRLDGSANLLEMSDYMKQELLQKGRGAMLVTGSSSEGEHFSYSQNGHGNISESCVTAYLLRWEDSLLRLEGNLKYGDLMERNIFNALFSAQSPDGRRIRYYNPFTGKRNYYAVDTFCCPGNFRRAIGELPEKVYYQIPDGGIALNLYAPSNKSFDVNGTTVALKQETDYPNSGEVKLTFTCAKPAAFPFRFRTPRWADAIQVKLNGQSANAQLVRKPELGYAELNRTWKTGDTVEISMPMTARLIRGRAAQAGKVALLYGPTVFCLGEYQNGELLKSIPGFAGLIIDPKTIGKPELDTSIRPDGLKFRVKGWTRQEDVGTSKTVDVVFTELTDESGLDLYFRIPQRVPGIVIKDDELVDLPRTTPQYTVKEALYGPKSADGNIESFFKPNGTIVAQLAKDYVDPKGELNREAQFPSSNGDGSWTVFTTVRADWPISDVLAQATLLNSKFQTETDEPGFQYGQEDPHKLGFLSNYYPGGNMSESWKTAFIDSVFNLAIAEKDRNNFLISHPVAAPERKTVLRWTPSENLAGKHFAVAGTVLCRAQANGVSLDGACWNGQNQFVNFGSVNTAQGKQLPSGINSQDFFFRVGGPNVKTLDFILSNNGDYLFDSTALAIDVYQTNQDGQIAVTDKVKSKFKGQFKTDLGSYDTLFGAAPSDTIQTLKLQLQNTETGEILYKELPKDAILEIE